MHEKKKQVRMIKQEKKRQEGGRRKDKRDKEKGKL